MQSHLCFDVVKGRRADDGEADQEHIRLRVREWSESVVIFLSRCIPEAQTYRLIVHHYARRIVVEADTQSQPCTQNHQHPDITYTVGMYSPGKAFVV